MSEIRFIADSMLGSLAKWLRILGFDTLYLRDIRDNDLIRIVREQKRILITRDKGFLKRKGIEGIIFIESNYLKEQLDEFLLWIRAKGIKPRPYRLCPSCNGEIIPAEKALIRNDVPEYTFHSVRNFYRCINCGKIYWKGSHTKRIERLIEEYQFNRV